MRFVHQREREKCLAIPIKSPSKSAKSALPSQKQHRYALDSEVYTKKLAAYPIPFFAFRPQINSESEAINLFQYSRHTNAFNFQLDLITFRLRYSFGYI